jgi:hypothetical protein
MQISLPDPNVEEVVREILGLTSNSGLSGKLAAFAQSADGARQISDATVAVASAMLLAKTAMPHEQAKFGASVDSQMALIRPYPPLVELAFALLEEEAATVDDVFRDRRLITDALFHERLAAIKHSLRH